MHIHTTITDTVYSAGLRRSIRMATPSMELHPIIHSLVQCTNTWQHHTRQTKQITTKEQHKNKFLPYHKCMSTVLPNCPHPFSPWRRLSNCQPSSMSCLVTTTPDKWLHMSVSLTEQSLVMTGSVDERHRRGTDNRNHL